MGEVDRYPHGTFCWVDLGTTDVAGAKDFYGALFGWDMVDLPGEDGGTYTICRLNGKDVAGMEQITRGEVGWDSNISVDDVEATTDKARELRATVVLEPLDIPEAGRAAGIRDPSGALMYLWEPGRHIGAGLVNEVGSWSWNELRTPDVEAATAFYGALFGWTTEETFGSTPRATFTMGKLLIGGVHAPTEREAGAGPAWTVGFRVESPDESAARVEELGGRVLLLPTDIPIGRFALVSDPQGAAFTITAFAGAFRGVDGS